MNALPAARVVRGADRASRLELIQVRLTGKETLDLEEEERQRIEVVSKYPIRITGPALSVGAVWWAGRAAELVATLLTITPAWRHMCSPPVLGCDEIEKRNATRSTQKTTTARTRSTAPHGCSGSASPAPDGR